MRKGALRLLLLLSLLTLGLAGKEPSPKGDSDLGEVKVLTSGNSSPHAALLYMTTPEIARIDYPRHIRRDTPFTILAWIRNDPHKTDFSHTTWATLHLKFAGGEKDVKMKKEGDRFSVHLSGLPRGEAEFRLEAGDNTGNRLLEVAPISATSFPPSEEELIPLVSDPKEPDHWIDPPADIRSLSVGFTPEALIAKLTVEGKVLRQQKGELKLFGYVVGIYNPDQDHGQGLLSGKGAIYAPGLTVVGLPPSGLFPFKAIVGNLQGIHSDPIDIHVLKRQEPGVVYYKIPRKLLGSNPCHCFQWIGLTLMAGKIGGELSEAILDATHYVRTVEQAHRIEVE